MNLRHPLSLVWVVIFFTIMSSLALPGCGTQSHQPPCSATVLGRENAQAQGVVGDGKTLNTAAINHAIEVLSAAGGGTLRFASGTYLTGTIYLRSRVTLQLDSGATIMGTTNLSDYPENRAPRSGDRLEYGRHALIHAKGQHDIAIVGQGRIQGQGDHPNFTKKNLLALGWAPRDAYLRRPYGLSFIRCQRVRVEGIRIENIAFWCQHYLDCDDVVVRGVTVDSKKFDCNNDGIDIDSSRFVRVSECHFSVGDDAICLKASYGDCENVMVTNCTATSLANGVKFGTASNGGFKNIRVSHITLNDIQAAGIALEIVDGGTLDGVTLDHFTMSKVGVAIFIRLGDMARRWTDDQPKRAIGVLKNVSISDVVAEEASSDTRPFCGSITGLPGHPVENVTITNVCITTSRDVDRELRQSDFRKVPEAKNAYPEYTMFGELPAYGLYLRHVRGLTMRHVQVSFSGQDYRSAIVCDDVGQLAINDLQARSLPESAATLCLKDVRGALLTGIAVPPSTNMLLQVEGRSRDVQLSFNPVAKYGRPVVGGESAGVVVLTPRPF